MQLDASAHDDRFAADDVAAHALRVPVQMCKRAENSRTSVWKASLPVASKRRLVSTRALLS
jgi:hypothetical protein